MIYIRIKNILFFTSRIFGGYCAGELCAYGVKSKVIIKRK